MRYEFPLGQAFVRWQKRRRGKRMGMHRIIAEFDKVSSGILLKLCVLELHAREICLLSACILYGGRGLYQGAAACSRV